MRPIAVTLGIAMMFLTGWLVFGEGIEAAWDVERMVVAMESAKRMGLGSGDFVAGGGSAFAGAGDGGDVCFGGCLWGVVGWGVCGVGGVSGGSVWVWCWEVF